MRVLPRLLLVLIPLVNVDSFCHHPIRPRNRQQRYHMAAQEAVTGLSLAGLALTNRVFNGGGTQPETPKDAATVVKELRIKILSLYGQFMSPDGRGVNYKGLAASDNFDDFVLLSQELKWVDLSSLSEVERRTVFINIYNSLIIHGLVIGPVPKTLVGRLNFYSTASYNISGFVLSLDDIEHGILRGNRATLLKPGILGSNHFSADDGRTSLTVPLDPRIHFALNCGARGCPPIRYYEAESLDERLELVAMGFFRGVQVDKGLAHIQLSQILSWYQRDFGDGTERGMLHFILPYLPEAEAPKLKELLDDTQRTIRVEYEPYDWSLNEA